ncbi:DnaJ family domain-containing protein [Paenibacillus filicis]|uniref:DnaJ family domain-containing protein n=1 Tax=Paenibacillus filicis TaxID=669464 RepID=A0ABU9DSY6_9BACL
MKDESFEAKPAPLPRDVHEDRDVADSHEREKQGWAEEAYQQFVSKGGLEQLPGFGKPLQVPTGDILDTVLRNANVKPPWIMLRTEIGTLMALCIKLMDKTIAAPELDLMLSDINKQIVELNSLAPSRTLHRHLVSRDNIREQYERWYDR